MKHPLALDLALRLFFPPRREDRKSRPILGSVLGIALSMVPLIVVLFLSDGMIRGITDRFIETGTYHLQLRSFQTLRQEEWREAVEVVSEQEGAARVFLEHTGMGMAYSEAEQTAATLRGIDPAMYESDPGFRRYLEVSEGEFRLDTPDSAMIGAEIARKLNLKAGDSFRILTGKTLSTGKFIPKVSRFRVRGIFATGYQDLDKLWILIPYDRARKILRDKEALTVAGVKTEAPYGDLFPLLQRFRDSLPGRWGIYSWKTLNRSQQSNFETTRSLLLFIMVLIVLVAVMNISSSMVMLVMENEQAIGIQKCMGLPPRTLGAQYVLTAAFAGGAGSFLGILAGCLLTLYLNPLLQGIEALLNAVLSLGARLFGSAAFVPVELLNGAYYLEEVPIRIEFSLLVLIFAATVLLSVTASWIPLRKAGRIKPLDILRKH